MSGRTRPLHPWSRRARLSHSSILCGVVVQELFVISPPPTPERDSTGTDPVRPSSPQKETGEKKEKRCQHGKGGRDLKGRLLQTYHVVTRPVFTLNRLFVGDVF